MNEKIEDSQALPNKGIERRDFIQGLATLPILGLFTLSWLNKTIHDRPKNATQSKKAIPEGLSDINVAFLGTGEQGYILLNACLKLPGLRFEAVCDIWESYNQRRAAQVLKKYKHEVNTYTDYREMLSEEKDLDAVIIATPDFWHPDHTVACLEANLHVYCEKEMSNTLIYTVITILSKMPESWAESRLSTDSGIGRSNPTLDGRKSMLSIPAR